MSELISGKEAKLAWANGEIVQIECTGGFFELSEHREFLNVFDNPKNKFRLKPRTISINGIEVPATFEPKEGDDYFYMNFGRSELYARKRFDGNYSDNSAIQIGAWRTEDEIKQVVAALRSVFGTQDIVRRMSSDSE